MNTDFICCLASAVLKDVLLMLKNSIHDAVIVVDKKKFPLGVITEQDVDTMYSSSAYKDTDILASDVIGNKKTYTCWEGDNVQVAIAMINDKRICLLPVVNSEFRLVGIMPVCNVVTSYENVVPFIRDIKLINTNLF